MDQEIKNNSLSEKIPMPYTARFLNPEDIISSLKINLGMKVAHFGCGTGYFTFPIARKVGLDGEVFALDILPEKVEAVESQAKIFGLQNISAKRANLEKKGGSNLPEESMDWVLVINMLYQNEGKSRVILEAARILKKAGHILIVDWKDTVGQIGPESDRRVSKPEIIKIVRKNELRILKDIELGDFHFGMIIAK